MKIQTIILFIWLAILANLGVSIQADAHQRIGPGLENQKEFKDFTYEIEKFSYSMLSGKVRLSRYLKRQILRDMEREIEQTKQTLIHNYGYKTFNYSKRDQFYRKTPKVYSKNNGVLRRELNKKKRLSELVQRLEFQEKLYYRFKKLTLILRNRVIINENKHRRLMYRFAETMSL